MGQPGRSGHRSRWIVSAGAVVAVGGVLAGTMIASAAGPTLPAKTPAQLIAAMRNATVPSAFSAVVTETANLGFPALPDVPGLSSSVFSAASLITGTHTADIWYAGPRHVRIAVPVSFGETDLRVNGRQVWLWDSRKQTATRYILPAAAGPGGVMPQVRLKALLRRHMAIAPVRLHAPAALRVGRHGNLTRVVVGVCKRLAMRRAIFRSLHPVQRVAPPAAGPVPADHDPIAGLSPLQAARKLLALVGPTTKVSVAGTVTVAGRPAYQLVIAPRSSGSQIGGIAVAVDAKLYLPLRIQVFARGSANPAFSVGFTSLTIGQPAMSNFTFTPPPGAKVKTVHLPAFGLPGMFRPGWAPVGTGSFGMFRAAPPPVLRHGPVARGPIAHLRLPRHFHGMIRPIIACRSLVMPMIPATAVPGPFAMPGGPRILGSGWLSVLYVPAMPRLTALNTMPGPHGLAEAATYQSTITGTMSGPAAVSSGPPAPIQALIHTLMNAATKVHGAWGSGRLLRTSLFSVLITSNGGVLIGAVTPAVLYADAAKVK